MENILNKMFEDGIFSNIFYAEENPAIISIKRIVKEAGEIKTICDNNKYYLKKITVKNTENEIINSLLHNLFVELNFKLERVDYRYFNRGLIKNLLTKKNPENLLNLISGYNWVITSDDIISELSKINGFESYNRNADKVIELVGRFNSQYNPILIFKLPKHKTHYTNKTIYCGNFDSITPVFNKKTTNHDNGEITIEYFYSIQKNMKKIIVE